MTAPSTPSLSLITDDLILQHPIPSPDLSHNNISSRTHSPTVARLEKSAERLSLGAGGDIGSEIRKLWTEEKRKSANASPVTSPPVGLGLGDDIRKIWADERRRSNIESPVMRYSPVAGRAGSIRSVSSKGSVNMGNDEGGLLRTVTARSVTSPLGRLMSPFQEADVMNGGTEYDDTSYLASREADKARRSPVSNVASPVQLGGLFVTNPSGSMRDSSRHPVSDSEGDDSRHNRNRDTITLPKRDGHITSTDGHDAATRSTSTASRSTLQKAGSIFKDFDGVYRNVSGASTATSTTSDFTEELERGLGLREPFVHDHPAEAVEDTGTDYSKLERHEPRPQSYAKPVQTNGMVYYPAPVPRVLNLPKKLSRRPAATTTSTQSQQARQSVFFGALPTDVRQSVMYSSRVRTPDSGTGSDRASNTSSPDRTTRAKTRQSMLSVGAPMKSLPPQLRASMFFGDGESSVPHKVEVKEQSAVLTLEGMLDAAARAPVAGLDPRRASRSPYGRRTASKSPANGNGKSSGTHSPERSAVEEEKKSRVNYLPLGKWDEDHASNSNNRDKEQRTSTESEATKSNPPIIQNAKPAVAPSDAPLAPWATNVLSDFDRFSVIEEAEAESHAQSQTSSPNLSSSDPSHTDPTPKFTETPHTLLAELALRKTALKSRARTAFDTVTPQIHNKAGPRATLLELDAEAEAERERKLKQRTVLAWEANSDDDGDEEKPLGMLNGPAPPTAPFAAPEVPPKSPKRAFVSPFFADAAPNSLLARHAMEESEPLSARRSRLFGGRSASSAFVAGDGRGVVNNQADANETEKDNKGVNENENETLAQRTQRLKELKALRDYLGSSIASTATAMSTGDVDAANIITSNRDPSMTAPPDTASGGGFASEVLSLARARTPDLFAQSQPPPQAQRQSSASQTQRDPNEEQAEECETLSQRRHRLHLQSSPFNRDPRNTIRAVSTASVLQPQSVAYHNQALSGQQAALYQMDYPGGYSGSGAYTGGHSGGGGSGGLLAQSEAEMTARKRMMWMHNSRAVSGGVQVQQAALGVGKERERERVEAWMGR